VEVYLRPFAPFLSMPTLPILGSPSCLDQHGPSAPSLSAMRPIIRSGGFAHSCPLVSPPEPLLKKACPWPPNLQAAMRTLQIPDPSSWTPKSTKAAGTFSLTGGPCPGPWPSPHYVWGKPPGRWHSSLILMPQFRLFRLAISAHEACLTFVV
jgi:hypothetical protein